MVFISAAVVTANFHIFSFKSCETHVTLRSCNDAQPTNRFSAFIYCIFLILWILLKCCFTHLHADAHLHSFCARHQTTSQMSGIHFSVLLKDTTQSVVPHIKPVSLRGLDSLPTARSILTGSSWYPCICKCLITSRFIIPLFPFQKTYVYVWVYVTALRSVRNCLFAVYVLIFSVREVEHTHEICQTKYILSS